MDNSVLHSVAAAQTAYRQRTGKEPNTVRMSSAHFAELLVFQPTNFNFVSSAEYTVFGMGVDLSDHYQHISCCWVEPEFPEIICRNCGAPSKHRQCDYCKSERL